MRTLLHGAAVLLLALPIGAGAQSATAGTADSSAMSWSARWSLEVRGSRVVSSERGQFYTLIERELRPGADALRATLPGLAVHLRITPRVTLVGGAERGDRTASSVHRVSPAGAAVQQRTSLEYTGVQFVGLEWRALSFGRAPRNVPDGRAQLLLGAGAGRASYALRQWGDFVDVPRNVVFTDDLRSRGDGSFVWAQAAVVVPVSRTVAFRGDVRQQRGRAEMSHDFASFDKLDLGGIRWGVGLVLTPFAGR